MLNKEPTEYNIEVASTTMSGAVSTPNVECWRKSPDVDYEDEFVWSKEIFKNSSAHQDKKLKREKWQSIKDKLNIYYETVSFVHSNWNLSELKKSMHGIVMTMNVFTIK